jgi:hypothetical protein
MTPLTTITGLTTEAADLLAAAGIHSTDQLSGENPARLHVRLELLAWKRGKGYRVPPTEQLEQWVAMAGMLTPPAEVEAMSMEEIPEAVTETAPEALPPAWIPPSLRAAPVTNGSPASGMDGTTPPDNTWRKVDPSRFLTIEDYNEGRTAVKPLSRDSLEPSADSSADTEAEAPSSRRAQRIRSTGEKLSRFVRRGVVHPRPLHTWIGALVSVLWRLSFVTGIAAFIYLIVQVENPGDYTKQVIQGSIVLLVLGCMQLHFAGRSRCRICSCNLFFSKNCLKNRKAHHLPGIGYVASLSLHLLLFGWFRCMYCGTAIRLRPSDANRKE